MTAEFFNNSKIFIILTPNTRRYRRLFWYWFNGQKKLCRYTKRWTVLCTKYITPFPGSLLGSIIIKWKQKHPIYDVKNNNCQHFVRDILAGIDKDSANGLLSQMEHKFAVSSSAPLAVVTTVEEHIRMYEENEDAVKQIIEYKQESSLFELYKDEKTRGKYYEKLLEEYQWDTKRIKELTDKFKKHLAQS